MQVGVISDVHGNRVALAAVLADMPPVDALLCAGDVVGYNPWPADCVDALRCEAGDADWLERYPAPLASGVPTVMGNHDRAVGTGSGFSFNSMAGAGVRHAKEHLSDDHLDWLRRLPAERTELDGRVKVVHGHPDDPDRYTYPRLFSPALLGDEDVLVMGHTHVQGHETYDEGIVMNPGSVGQPRDRDPEAAYALLDLDTMTVDERRVPYDIERVVKAVREADLPEQVGTRLRKGR